MTRIFQILTLFAIVVVILMSLRPGHGPGGIPHLDKVQHFLAYAVMAALARLGWPKLWGGWIVVALIALGVALELAQHVMAWGRTGSIADALANALGVLAVIVAFHLIRRRPSN